jgi:hypothetical protein
MNILGSIMGKILGHSARASEANANASERCIPAILDEWARSASGGELRSLCEADRAGDLAKVLRAMSAALHPRPRAGAVDRFIETAAAHGARRRAQGVHEACLFEEYDFLGAAVPHGLRSCRTAPLAPEDLLALEGGLTTAILAGLRGFHRGEFERRGTWAEALSRTASESADMAQGAAPLARQEPPASPESRR